MALSLPIHRLAGPYPANAHPRTKLGRTTLWFGYLAVGLEVLRVITRSPPAP